MKLFKRTQPPPSVSGTAQTGEVPGNKEKVGQPMLFPIVFCLVSGLLLILLNHLALRITGYTLAAGLIGLGIWQAFEYIRSEPLVRILESKLAIGLILLVTGIMLAFSPEALGDLLPYAWGLSLLFGGFLKVQYAFDRKSLGSEKWWILLILAAVSLLIGIISLLNPAFLGDKKELVIGILLLVEAVLDITVFLLLKRKISKLDDRSRPAKPDDPALTDAQPERLPEQKQDKLPETEPEACPEPAASEPEP